MLSGATGEEDPPGYERRGDIIGRPELLTPPDDRLFAESEFVGRAQLPRTTSAVEAKLRHRHLERLVDEGGLDRSAPALELGCADGLVTRQLLELGFEQLVSIDIVANTLTRLEGSLDDGERERILLIVDDLLELPFERGAFGSVIAWGVLSVCGDFDRALRLGWDWLAPGGHLLLAEPVFESILAYALVRGDLDELERILEEGTRPGVWEERSDPDAHRYTVNRQAFYEGRLAALDGAQLVSSGGVSMLPSLALGGVAQETEIEEANLDRLAEHLTDPSLDDLKLWRQVFWLVRKG